MRPANWRWLRWRARRISRTCPATCKPASAEAGTGSLVTSCGANTTGSSMSRGRWHFLQREFDVLYCMSLQCSHRTTSRVSTLTRVVAIGWVRSARAGLRGAFFAPRYSLLSGMGTIIVKYNFRVKPKNTLKLPRKTRKTRTNVITGFLGGSGPDVGFRCHSASNRLPVDPPTP